MSSGYSFQDELARQRAEIEREAERAEGRRGFARSQEYKAGEGTAAAIRGQVARFGTTWERNTKTLREAAARQPSTLEGRVAAGLLAEAAAENGARTPDTTAETRRIEALQLAEHRTRAEAAAQHIADQRHRRSRSRSPDHGEPEW